MGLFGGSKHKAPNSGEIKIGDAVTVYTKNGKFVPGKISAIDEDLWHSVDIDDGTFYAFSFYIVPETGVYNLVYKNAIIIDTAGTTYHKISDRHVRAFFPSWASKDMMKEALNILKQYDFDIKKVVKDNKDFRFIEEKTWTEFFENIKSL